MSAPGGRCRRYGRSDGQHQTCAAAPAMPWSGISGLLGLSEHAPSGHV